MTLPDGIYGTDGTTGGAADRADGTTGRPDDTADRVDHAAHHVDHVAGRTDSTAGRTAVPQDATVIWSWASPMAPDAVDTARPGHAGLLDEQERARAARMLPAKARRFVTSRVALRSILAGVLSVPAREITLGRYACPGCADPGHGPPRVVWPRTPLRISLSHTWDRGLLAVSTGPVGVDIERHRTVDADALARTVLSPAELAWLERTTDAGTEARTRAFYRCWTRKEAVLKGVGTGIAGDLRRLDVRPDRAQALLRVPVGDRLESWWVRNLPLGDSWTAALSRPAGTPAAFELRTWPAQAAAGGTH
ncbi:4'-phosphopantetheinyl transferase superfamily protein [Streptomyces sp. MST-110588]|uniref:4'-phosphopantetheinyl transferase family protein n=1 Tax=Streptomyces sp. MST-110588 TaxID=2833628 RepID=UPI001F5C581A|nr:4'-phosphopantetheinyl transferase superfamily protein [Streptomyces sp. MST-110588]UNO39109.1 4'-phosphopantetheinyl transferase superfamily protein [Streptomyces sp. MST-110588]